MIDNVTFFGIEKPHHRQSIRLSTPVTGFVQLTLPLLASKVRVPS